ncbi:uncharacterized protein [Cherax quadricarinatus]|uniref:uncharacterized protein n=1 Tax=Cherax quadricarinatus TaxID=27406 RepID=UPI00387E5710
MKVVLLLVLLAAAATTAAPMAGPEFFFGYEPEPAPESDSESSYTSISSLARAYKPPTFFPAILSVKRAPVAARPIRQKSTIQPFSAIRPFSPIQPDPAVQESLTIDPAPEIHKSLAAQESLGIQPISQTQTLKSRKRPLSYKPVLYYKAPVKYNFDWSVKDDFANDVSHEESRDGDHTRGSYSVLLSDGRLQTVTYYVDGDSGYVAEVKYKDVARFPEPAYRPIPAYRPVHG